MTGENIDRRGFMRKTGLAAGALVAAGATGARAQERTGEVLSDSVGKALGLAVLHKVDTCLSDTNDVVTQASTALQQHSQLTDREIDNLRVAMNTRHAELSALITILAQGRDLANPQQGIGTAQLQSPIDRLVRAQNLVQETRDIFYRTYVRKEK